MLSTKLNSELRSRNLQIVTAAQTVNFVDQADEVSVVSWPKFMLYDEVANRHWVDLNKKFDNFQFALIEKDSKKWIAVGNSIPVFWPDALEELPDKGWDWALAFGMENDDVPNLLCALAIQILPEYRGKGLSTLMVQIMKHIGHLEGFDQLIAPVRPNKKCDYPLLPMSSYLEWSRAEERFDPWVRVHERLGARLLKICPQAMFISETLEAWTRWTGMSFQNSGEYVVPGALTTVTIDTEKNRGVYVEPNVWMVHTHKN